MNVRVAKSVSYKIIAETFGQRYVAINVHLQEYHIAENIGGNWILNRYCKRVGRFKFGG